MRVMPIFDRVLIRRDEIEKTKSGLHLAADMQQIKNGSPTGLEFNTGTIVETGEGVTHPGLCPGVKVYFGKHAGAYIHPNLAHKRQLAMDGKPEEASRVEDIKLFVCAEADIIAILEEEKE